MVTASERLRELEASNVIDWPVSTTERTRIVLDALPVRFNLV